jgi:hypothetical protein
MQGMAPGYPGMPMN